MYLTYLWSILEHSNIIKKIKVGIGVMNKTLSPIVKG